MRKMSKKFIAFITAAGMLAGILSGCGTNGNNSGNIGTSDEVSSKETEKQADSKETSSTIAGNAEEEILFWHSYSEGEEKIFQEQVLTAFEKVHPEIHVNAVRMPYEGMDQQLITAVSGDAAPDVMRMDITWVAQMAKLGALEAVDGMDGFEGIKGNALESSMVTNLYGGNYYGLPLNANTTVAIYNKKLLTEYGFSQPSETLEELLAAKDKADPAGEKWLFAVQGTYNWAMLPFLWTLGGSVTDADFTKASGYLNSEATVKALETVRQWYEDGIIGPSVMGEQPDTWGGMSGNNYGMIVEGPWYYSSSQEAQDTTIPALLPSVEGRSISIIGGEDVVMTSTSKHKEAAWTFMKFLMEDEQQLAMSKAGMIPTMKTAMDQVDTSESPYVEIYMEQLKSANPRTPSAQWPQIEETLNQAFELVFRGEKSARDALDEAAETIDELLAE